MNIQNLRIGSIIIGNIENNIAKVIVVGTEPTETDNSFIFKAVLKENNREVYKVSLSNTTIAKENGAAYVINTFDDAVTFNIRNVFPRKTNEFYDEMTNKINLALRKRNWAYDTLITVPVLSHVGAPADEAVSIPEPAPEPEPTTRQSVFTVTLTHNIDEPVSDVIESLNEMISDEFDDVSVVEYVNPEL